MTNMECVCVTKIYDLSNTAGLTISRRFGDDDKIPINDIHRSMFESHCCLDTSLDTDQSLLGLTE